MEKLSIFMLISLCLYFSTSQAGGATNAYWTCDEEINADEQHCIFIRKYAQEPWGPHRANKNVGAEFFRRVQDKDKTLLDTAGRPLNYCDVMVGCKQEVEAKFWTTYEDEWAFVQMFEMMAPVRDIAMYAPDSLDQWFQVTQMIQDCGLKTEHHVEGDIDTDYYSTDTIWRLMMDTHNKDTHRDVLKYLDEVQNELICLMTTNGNWDISGQCDDTREEFGLEEDESSTCWQAHYNSMPDSYQLKYHPSVDVFACNTQPTDDCAPEGREPWEETEYQVPDKESIEDLSKADD